MPDTTREGMRAAEHAANRAATAARNAAILLRTPGDDPATSATEAQYALSEAIVHATDAVRTLTHTEETDDA